MDAYARWTCHPPGKRLTSTPRIGPALDREEAAANVYAKLMARVGDLLETGLDTR